MSRRASAELRSPGGRRLRSLRRRCLAVVAPLGRLPGGEIWWEARGAGPMRRLPAAPRNAFWLVSAPVVGLGDLDFVHPELAHRGDDELLERLEREVVDFLASRSPRVLLALRSLLDRKTPLAERLAAERDLFPDYFRAPDRLEGISAFLDGRPPRFSPAPIREGGAS